MTCVRTRDLAVVQPVGTLTSLAATLTPFSQGRLAAIIHPHRSSAALAAQHQGKSTEAEQGC